MLEEKEGGGGHNGCRWMEGVKEERVECGVATGMQREDLTPWGC